MLGLTFSSVCAQSTSETIALEGVTKGVELIAPWTVEQAEAGNIPTGWEAQFHPKIERHTVFEFELLDRKPALRMTAESSYGTWVYRFSKPVEIGELKWSWSVGEQPTGADLKLKEADDAAAKLCLFVEIDESTLGLGTRLALGAARTLSGEDLPAATLCYVWATEAQQYNEIFPNPYTDRVVNWVLQAQPASRRWQLESRQVSADVLRVFGEEIPSKVVKIQGIAIGADSDNTDSKAIAYFRQPLALSPIDN